MLKRCFVFLTLVVIILLSGCSTRSQDIASFYSSPVQYANFDCEQIQMEEMRIRRELASLGANLDKAANNDALITGVGVVLFWPALFALGGNEAQEAEYARLKGDYNALQEAAVQKKCQINSIIESPEQAITAQNQTKDSDSSTLPEDKTTIKF